MTNRLAQSASAYLRSHANNPVDWFPWGDEAFEQARERDVPVFLSVGYSSCHWCHVMAHESFEDERVAATLNEFFVNIKVDREELPAVDARYMQATQALTGHGGWPMSVWLDHERRAWFAGTYFPPAPAHGSPGFMQVLLALNDAWTNERDKVSSSATHIDEALKSMSKVNAAVTSDSHAIEVALNDAVNKLASDFDPVFGGFGGAPKFPPALVLRFLLRWHGFLQVNNREIDPRVMAMIETTCTRMALGGLYDQLGSGFARYSVDAQWVVPHFEKMLYDNAQLLDVYTRWYLATGDPLAERIACETADFIIRDLGTSDGGFASALDADSADDNGNLHEGAYYLWTRRQLETLVGPDDADFLGVPASAKEPAPIVLSRQDDERLMRLREVLLTVRAQWQQPARDDKVVTSWTAIAVESLARAAAVFGRPEWLERAVTAANLLRTVHTFADGAMTRVSYSGEPAQSAPAVLEDYAQTALAYATLAQITGEQLWLSSAREVVTHIRAEFVVDGLLTDTSKRVLTELGLSNNALDMTDNVTPSGWSAAVDAALVISSLTGDRELRSWVDELVAPLVPLVADHPRFAGQAAAVLTSLLDGPREVAVDAPAGSHRHALALRTIAPGAVVCAGTELPLMQGRTANDGAVYVCHHFVCERPLQDIDEIRRALGVN